MRMLSGCYLACVILLVGGCTHGAQAPPPRQNLHNWGEVDPGKLYRAARTDAEGIRQLVENDHIRTIVNLAEKDDDCDAIHQYGLRYFHLRCDATTQNTKQMKQFLTLMNDPHNWPVYVHCDRGADRTGEAVGAYRIVYQNWTTTQAIDELPKYHYFGLLGEPKKFLRSLTPGDRSITDGVREPNPSPCER
jgi:protein tyrosine/serine phosphatase